MEEAFQLGVYGAALFGGGFVAVQFRAKAMDDVSSLMVIGALVLWALPLASVLTGLDLTSPVVRTLNNVSGELWTLME